MFRIIIVIVIILMMMMTFKDQFLLPYTCNIRVLYLKNCYYYYYYYYVELISSKKQENYATTITWIRTKLSFAILRTALVCLRGTRSRRRKTNVQENDLEIEKGLAGLT